MHRNTTIHVLTATLIAAANTGPCHSEPARMQLVPVSPLIKVIRKANIPSIPPNDSAETTKRELLIDGAVEEIVSAQVLLLPAVSDAVSPQASIKGLTPGAVRLQWLRYVDVTKNSPNVPADELIGAAPLQIPDPFWENAELPVEPGQPQPLWIEVEIPAGTEPGDYDGEVAVTGSAGKCSLPIVLRVRAFGLPEVPHQKVIQWWGFPGKGFEHLQPGTDAYWEYLRRMCGFLKRHRLTEIQSPFDAPNGNAWRLFEQKTDSAGKLYWDASLWEKFAEIAFAEGMRAVHFIGLGRHTKLQLEPDARVVVDQVALDRLAAIEEIVKRRGWRGRVLTSVVDEPFPAEDRSYREALAKVRKTAPSIGVIEAQETDNLGDADIHVPKLNHMNLWWPKYNDLKRNGKEVWFYTCAHPQGRYPNRFLDQPLVKMRALHWISYLYGLDGYLHWGLNWFNKDKDPYTEEGSNLGWPPGDGQIAYPGKDCYLGSIRLSTMRDGLQDYEYLWTLEDRLRALRARLGEEAEWLDPRQRPLELCKRVVQSFYDHTRDPEVLLQTRAAIADEIEALDAKPLLYVQTTPPDGTVTPEGPIQINVRGIVTPGAKVTINGKAVIPENITESGCFVGFVFLTGDSPDIVVTAELNGVVRTCRRSFRVVK